jgi:hypothetical protein
MRISVLSTELRAGRDVAAVPTRRWPALAVDGVGLDRLTDGREEVVGTDRRVSS